jgi:hypothetical protein
VSRDAANVLPLPDIGSEPVARDCEDKASAQFDRGRRRDPLWQ